MRKYLSILLAGVIHLSSASSELAAEQAPNIVFILSDDQAWTDSGFMGHADIQTTPRKE
jgi:putative cell wall-binding protein